MNHILSASLLSLAFSSISWAQGTTEPLSNNNEGAQKSQMATDKELWQKFSNLSQQKRQDFQLKYNNSQNIFNQKRIFDTIESLDELDSIFNDHPATLNLRGACYVELRAFNKAKDIFNRLIQVSPDNTNLLFNIAEIEFVTKNWQVSHDLFSDIILKVPASKSLLRLCEFKVLLCKLKLGQEKEAKAIMNQYDRWDDSPFYHYSRCAILYHEGKVIEASKTLRDVRIIWANSNILAPWQDTLVEFGYIRSFYGGDIEDEIPQTEE